MPGPADDLTTTWIRSDHIPKPPYGSLDDREVDVFLEFLFAHLAQRPAKLTLRDSAPVAHYLEWLALQGVRKAVMSEEPSMGQEHSAARGTEEERRVRSNANDLSKIIWGLLRQYGQCRGGRKKPEWGCGPSQLRLQHSAVRARALPSRRGFPAGSSIGRQMRQFQLRRVLP
jgi:hypothetical protein